MVFSHVLNFFRGDFDVHVEYLTPHEIAALRADATYYGVDSLNEFLDDFMARKEADEAQRIEAQKQQEIVERNKRYTWDQGHCPSHFLLSQDGKTVYSSNSTAGLVTTNVLLRRKKVTDFRLKINKEPNWTYIGVATKTCITSGVHPQSHPQAWLLKSHRSANTIEVYHKEEKVAEIKGENFGAGDIIRLRVNEHMILSVKVEGREEEVGIQAIGQHLVPLPSLDNLYFAVATAYRGHELKILEPIKSVD